MFRNQKQSATMDCLGNSDALWKSAALHKDKQSRFQSSLAISEIESFGNHCPKSQRRSNPKVLKLIGNKQENIQNLVQGFGCICGCKMEFRNVMVLLMDKIYKLREERNAFKDELAFLRHTQKEQSKMTRCEDVGTNTAEMTNLEDLQNHLMTLRSEEELTSKKVVQKQVINTEQMDQMFGSEQELLLTPSELNDTNLLQSPSKHPDKDEQGLSLELNLLQTEENNVLRQHRMNNQKMQEISTFLKHRNINANKLQNYIQKLHCVKALGKYDENKRKRELF